jgi:hypothetical protein
MWGGIDQQLYGIDYGRSAIVANVFMSSITAMSDASQHPTQTADTIRSSKDK